MQTVWTARGRAKRTAADVGKAIILPRDREGVAYARTAVRKLSISGGCPVMDSSAPSVEKQWFGNDHLVARCYNANPDPLKTQ